MSETKNQLGLLTRHFPDRAYGFLKPATIDFAGRIVPLRVSERGFVLASAVPIFLCIKTTRDSAA